MGLITSLIGPLCLPECQRSAQRGWVILTRAAAGLVLAFPLVISLWWWWMRVEIDPEFRGDRVIPWGLAATVGLSTALALLLSPALLAGTLAGERERGSIGLLLTTSVDAREIVLGRLFGKLIVVATMLLAGWPFLIGFAALADLGPNKLLAVLALPMAVGLGAGGLAIAASSVSRKGWSALMSVYFGEVILLLLPMIGLIPGLGSISNLLDRLNPFASIMPTIAGLNAGPAWATIAIWLSLGSLGIAFASWRLRPSYLAHVGGKARGDTRTWKVPLLAESQPMLWKELHIERASALGWFGRCLGLLLFVYLFLGSLVLAVIAIGSKYLALVDSRTSDRLAVLAGQLYEDPAVLFAFLIPLAIGLRAAVSISSERERSTWDALLTSPLTGREILVGKLWGSLYRLRWLFVAVLVSWLVALGFGQMRLSDFFTYLSETLCLSFFAAAVGIRASLACSSATRSMSVTVGVVAVTLIVASIVMLIATLTIMLLFLLVWMVLSPLGLVTSVVRAWVPFNSFGLIYSLLMAGTFLSLALSIISESWTRFDVLCGRATGNERQQPTPSLELGSSEDVISSDPLGQNLPVSAAS